MSKPIQNIAYFSNERFPSELACTRQQMLMCEAFARNNLDVTLHHPRYQDQSRKTIQEILNFYEINTPFSIEAFSSLLHLSKPLVDGRRHLIVPFIGGASVRYQTQKLAMRKLKKGEWHDRTLIYSRNLNSTRSLLNLRKKHNLPYRMVYEVHALDQHGSAADLARFLKQVEMLVCISAALKQALVKFGVDDERILVAHDGVKSSQLQQSAVTRLGARQQLELPLEPIAVYTGQLLPGKGVETIVAAAKLCPEVQFFIIGGHGRYLEQLVRQTRQLTNVHCPGFMPSSRVQLFQAAADVLLLPPTADHAISPYTSPLKLFEYMAARRPIIASHLSVLEEILTDGRNARCFSPGDADDLVEKIREILDHPKQAEKLAARAFHDVRQYTWDKRAQAILNAVNEAS